jgi:cyclopropane fatty-acyl-phospholipid synthase-like methyltransferase
MQRRGIKDIELARVNVLELEKLPHDWQNYDLIVSASMLEYVPRERLTDALRGLRARLGERGTFVLFITRRNPFTRLLIGLWWAANLYTKDELRDAFQAAGFSEISFRRFPAAAKHLSLWGHIVEARR